MTIRSHSTTITVPKSTLTFQLHLQDQALLNLYIRMSTRAPEQDLALQQHFPYESSKFSENSNYGINLPVFSWGLKLGLFGIFDALFPFLAFIKL